MLRPRASSHSDSLARLGLAETIRLPEGAEVLLEDALPHLSAAQRRALMVNTALPAGYPLSGATPEQQFWQRLNLSAAWEMAQKRH